MRSVRIIGVLLLVSGCDGISLNQTANETASGGEGLLKPGKYQIDYVREVMVPSVPSEPAREVTQQCFTAEDVKHAEVILMPGTEQCRDREAHVGNGEVSARMRCPFPEAGESDVGFEIRGSYDEDSAELTGDATLPEGTARETRTFKRLGDC